MRKVAVDLLEYPKENKANISELLGSRCPDLFDVNRAGLLNETPLVVVPLFPGVAALDPIANILAVDVRVFTKPLANVTCRFTSRGQRGRLLIRHVSQRS